MDGSFPGVGRHTRFDREGERPVARLCPPTVLNEQSSCRDIASLLAWSHLPGASGLAPLLCDSTRQVALPMTSNPKSLQSGQHSSPIPCILGRRGPRQRSVQPRSTPLYYGKSGEPCLSKLPPASHCLGRQVVGHLLQNVTNHVNK